MLCVWVYKCTTSSWSFYAHFFSVFWLISIILCLQVWGKTTLRARPRRRGGALRLHCTHWGEAPTAIRSWTPTAWRMKRQTACLTHTSTVVTLLLPAPHLAVHHLQPAHVCPGAPFRAQLQSSSNLPGVRVGCNTDFTDNHLVWFSIKPGRRLHNA